MGLRFQQKLIIPSASRPLIDRPHLLQQLEQAISTKRVVALAAPAGWGKTTALSQWARNSSLPTAWYTLDAADRDPHLFLDYLLHSAASFVPAAADILAQLSGTEARGMAELARKTALAFANASAPFVLVLDDFHMLDDDQSHSLPGAALALDLLASIAEYAPNCHLVFASRTLPALHGMVRMAAQQRASVFDYTALQLSTEEVQRLAGVASGLTLSDEHAEQLTTQMGGWVTGISLSIDHTLSGQRTQSIEFGGTRTAWQATGSQQSSLSTEQIYAFFAEQIIAPLAPELQRFLEETSVLEDLSPERCDKLRLANDSAYFLDEIRRHGLFVSSRAGWLAYHSLFRDFLRARLGRDPYRRRELLLRAGELYRSEDEIERALDCYLAAGATDQAITLMRTVVPRLRRRSRQTTLLACFERFQSANNHTSLHTTAVHPQTRNLPADLLLAQARVYSDLALWERAYLCIQFAETIGDPETRLEARILLADLSTIQGDHQRARSVLAELSGITLPARLQLNYQLTTGRIQMLSGDVLAAIDSLEHAHRLASTSADSVDDPSTLATIYDFLGWAYATQGDRHTALRHLKRADACWQSVGNSGNRTMTLNNLGMLAMEEGRYGEAHSAFEDGLALARQTARRREETILRCSMAELDILEGELELALARFTEAHTLAVRTELPGSIEAAAVGALWAATLQGDMALAQAWNDITEVVFAPSQPEVRGRLALARSMLALLQPHPVFSVLSDLSAEAMAVEPYLSEPERAYLALLRATLTFEKTGWPRTTPEWEVFSTRAAKLPDVLLQRFVAPHRKIFEVASGSCPLARRITEALQQHAPRRWQISALGTFTCLVDGTACDLSPLHRALLVRLLDAGPQGLAVERLWEHVWGDNLISMPALHQALRRLRVQTGLAVAARDGFCAIRSPWDAIEYDVRALEQALEPPASADAIRRAVTLYRGEFLSGAPLSASLWIEARRAHLQQRYLDALEQFARSVERDSPQQAIHYYQQVLQIDGCREHTAAQLMRLAARFGNRSLVNATFEHLKGALRSLGTTPEPATAALYQQLH